MAVDSGLLTDLRTIEGLFQKMTRIDDGFGFDIETGYSGPPMEKYSLHPETAFIAGASFSADPRWARYTPLRHDRGTMVDEVEFARLFAQLLGSGKGIAHNSIFELRHLAKFFRERLSSDELREAGLRPNGYFPLYSDSMVEAFLLGQWPGVGLKDLTLAVFGHKQAELESLFPDGMTSKQKKSMRFNVLDLSPEVVSYACEDAAWCLALSRKHRPMVKDKLLYRVDMGLVPIIAGMEDRGLAIDWAAMQRWNTRALSFADALRAEIMRDLSEAVGAPVDINLGSSQQVAKVLFDQMGLRTTRMTSSGNMSTDAKALEGLAKKIEVVRKIQNHRELIKLSGSYLEKYPRDFNYAEDGRAHPSHNTCFVVSGRFSVTDPAYQQLPKKYHYQLADGQTFDLKFRDFVIAAPGHYLIGFDYSQIELRVLAGLSGEPSLVKAYAEGIDVHQMTASKMFEIPLDAVTDDQRSKGKAQPVDEPVLTPTGWRPIGELQVGDEVIGSDGKATVVTGVFPQGVREVFRVTTTDGAETRSCAEHLWTVTNRNDGRTITRPLADGPLSLASMGLSTSVGAAKFQLPERPAVHYAPGPELPIDPYVLGLLLGDGGFRHDWGPSFSSADPELIAAVSAEHERLGGRVQRATVSTDKFEVIYLVSGERGARNPMTAALRELGLWGHRDSEKFVPELYLRAAPEDRLALLQGLCDTDGCALASAAQFRVTAEELARAAQEIARSLGGWSSLTSEMPKNYGNAFIRGREVVSRKLRWGVHLKLPAGSVPFRLARKLAKLKPVKYSTKVCITGVESVGEMETVCIAVAAHDSLYMSHDFLLTHNTQNFALMYGQGPKGMAERMGISVEEARAFTDRYFAVYSKIKSWVSNQTREGVARGRTVSKFGRVHPIWALESDKPAIRANGERLCVNAPVQGGAADIMRIAMVRSAASIQNAGMDDRIHLVMNIHDALVFEVERTVSPQRVVDLVQPEVTFEVPGWPRIVADWEIGTKWGSMKKLTLDADNRIVVAKKEPAPAPEPEKELVTV